MAVASYLAYRCERSKDFRSVATKLKSISQNVEPFLYGVRREGLELGSTTVLFVFL